MGAKMKAGRSTRRDCAAKALGHEANEMVARPRFGHIPESTAVRDIVDVAMVGLIGGGPRLAMRAARVLLEDSYASHFSARQSRVHVSNHRGE
jgi:hypothetical protein